MSKIALEFCDRGDTRYQAIRNRHYVANRGCHGQQIHFVVWLDDEIVGIISGASSVYGVKSRDMFFAIPADKDTKQNYYLPAIVNNVVFRLEHHEPNLATRVLKLWREATAILWERLYSVPVIGFETFVVEEDWRKGSLYKADNWTLVGETQGNTKVHTTGMTTSHTRATTTRKLVYCRWRKRPVSPTTKYVSSWRASTEDEKARAKHIATTRKELIGHLFSWKE